MPSYVNVKPVRTGAFSLVPDRPEFRKAFTHYSKYDGEEFHNYRIVGSGYLALPRAATPIGVNDARTLGDPIAVESNWAPRSVEQEDFVDSGVECMRAGRSFIAQAQTGFGKTACWIEALVRYGRKTLIVVTKEDLRDRWVEDIVKLTSLQSSDIGLVQGSVFDIDKPFVIAMIHTLATDRMQEMMFTSFGVTVWDETHRVGADYFANSAWKVPALIRVGLSATPNRRDGRDVVLKTHIGPVLVKATVNHMVPKVLLYRTGWKLPRKKTVVGNKIVMRPIPHQAGRMGHITKIMGASASRNAVICDFVKRSYDKGRIMIVFADTLKHLDRLRTQLEEQGIPASDVALYVGGLSKAQREAAKHKRILLATYSFTSEGTDIPHLDTMIMATPKSNVEQIVGRIRREHPGKKQPVVFDMLDMDSPVFRKFGLRRQQFYRQIGAEIVRLN